MARRMISAGLGRDAPGPWRDVSVMFGYSAKESLDCSRSWLQGYTLSIRQGAFVERCRRFRYSTTALPPGRDMPPTSEQLLSALRSRLDAAGASWLDAALAAAGSGTLTQLLTAYTGASRRVGKAPLALDTPDGDASAWTLEDAARALLLLQRGTASPDPGGFEADVVACYEQGDSREQESWLRTVAALPAPERFLPLVIDACRTNIIPLFAAVACDNPYPARYFPDSSFNQMVLKALFNNVPLARVRGLDGRLNPELARMAGDYAAERMAAGRTVPADIALVTTPIGSTQAHP